MSPLSRRTLVSAAGLGLLAPSWSATTAHATPLRTGTAGSADGADGERSRMQRWLLSRYARFDAFPRIDPRGRRPDAATMNGLVFALQHALGIPAAEASIVLGPTTRSLIAATGLLRPGDGGDADDRRSALVRVFQGALLMDGADLRFTGVFDSATESAVRRVQARDELPVTGEADPATWTGLLVSTGDLSRTARAVDTSTTITAARAAALREAGYRTVGRYLTGRGKRYGDGELDVIFDAGLTTFPIMQESNRAVGDLSATTGERQGRSAAERAGALGFPEDTVIFFAVDFDISDDESRAAAVPYFRGVGRALGQAPRRFRPGVYGPRALCTLLADASLAEASFVSGMSTGYRGNLGHRLPSNWWYDQIENTHVGHGDGRVEVDRNIVSSRARPVSRADMVRPVS
ncbi:glycoside hydrolase domain-containing protein [Mycetocola reblochoni]|uniref:DUF1906 domain-containing protein n=2 Tax=Mycetocola reblochoni TaxID=331618 RepID=A0A3L6ZI12_9MICO|nr:glycoside hydrolase domain-containing protein [Mycetocola reblochoni]RLP67704.1 DUF1906 domain-containing protein [Mycetocola reblochoni]SJN38658.1 putative peptidoglycan binding domain protein [Mycetocola reblochoni REB411]